MVVADRTADDRREPEESELEALMADVFYEHEMFTIAAARIEGLALSMEQGASEGDDAAEGELGFERNAWVEVFPLYLRNLIDFYVSKPIKDDVVARHYAPGWTGELGGESLAWLVELAPVLNKRLAHITAYRRRVDADVDAKLVSDIRSRLTDVYRRWSELLPSERRQWFHHTAED